MPFLVLFICNNARTAVVRGTKKVQDLVVAIARLGMDSEAALPSLATSLLCPESDFISYSKHGRLMNESRSALTRTYRREE